MDDVQVKQEVLEQFKNTYANRKNVSEIPVINLDSSDESEPDDSPSSSGGDDTRTNGKRSRVSGEGIRTSKRKKHGEDVVLPGGFLDPLPPKSAAASTLQQLKSNKQFWKAGDFDGGAGGDWDTSSGGMDHVRVHPRFLHSNATSHKWVLGAFAELLDNSLDEVCNGATYVKIDMLENRKAGTRMLLIEDNGGGMDPDKMRQCMSLGYSLKSKVADTIGQYGNGFKTSTMRLGADVIVFSRSAGKEGKGPTQSIGLLSYTFLRTTGKEDIIVPMLDYERDGQEWKKLTRSSAIDWERNVEAIAQWSPFSSEAELMRQFDHMKDQGTRIIIYNLWEDDQGQLELDFDTDQHDIQIRGVNRDPKSIQMAQQFPNSRHFLTYRHSLRSYAAILYLRVPPGFRMILRGKDVEHHNIVNDMMMTNVVTYRPQPGADGIPKDANMVAIVTMGFVKDAKAHIDVQGFNVYHKNRLIKPFWRLWNAAGSDGRGVIGVLEANFVEPAHDKQGFERTIVLSRLETRLIQMQKTYWSTYCHKIGYAPRRNKNNLEDSESPPDYTPETPGQSKKKSTCSRGKILGSQVEKVSLHKHQKEGPSNASRHHTASFNGNGYPSTMGEKGNHSHRKYGKGASSLESTSPSAEDIEDDDLTTTMPVRQTNGNSQKRTSVQEYFPKDGPRTVRSAHHVGQSEAERDVSPDLQIVTRSQSRAHDVSGNSAPPKAGNIPDVSQNSAPPKSCNEPTLDQLMEENRELKERLKRREEELSGDLLHDLECERNRCKSLEAQLEEEKQKKEELIKEQDSIIIIFQEERERRDLEEEKLRKKLKEATVTIQELVERVRQLELEKMKAQGNKWGQ